MKNMLLIPFVFLFFISIINGQNISFGVQGGANYSKLINHESFFLDLGNEFKTGYRAGINTVVDLADWVAVRAEFNIQREGGRNKLYITDMSGRNIERGNYYLHFDYLSLPLMMQFSFGKKIKLLTHIGLEFKYLVKQLVVIEGLVVNGMAVTSREDSTDQYSKGEQSVFAGLGLSFPVKSNLKIIVLGRSAIGLNQTGPTAFAGSFKHLSFSATAGVQYYLHKKEKGID